MAFTNALYILVDGKSIQAKETLLRTCKFAAILAIGIWFLELVVFFSNAYSFLKDFWNESKFSRNQFQF